MIGRAIVTVAVLAWVGRDLDVDAALAALAEFDGPTTVACLALVAVDRLLMLQRWLLLIRPTTTMLTGELARIFFVSSFVGSFMPAGIGGDAARAWSVTRRTGQTAAAVASVIVDRWLGLLAVGFAGCVGTLASLAHLPDGARPLLFVATLFLALAGAAVIYADRIVARWIPMASRNHRVVRAIVRVGDAMGAYRGRGPTLAQVAGLSLVVQGLRVVLAWVIGTGLGIALPFSYYWVFMPINIIVILLPLSLGGVGLPQGTMVWSLAPLGVDPTRAFLLSMLFIGIGVVGNLPGAWMFLRGSTAESWRRS